MERSSLRRDLSYRKPVPLYVPTPPASPHVPPASPARSSSSLHQPAQDVSPPLPDEWQELIELASSHNTNASSVAFPGMHMVGHVPAFPLSPPASGGDAPSIPTTVSRKLSVDNVSIHSIPYVTRSASSRHAGNRKSHLNYRPPTPPIQARCKRQHAADEDPPFLDSTLIPLHIIYPDAPLLDGAEAIRPIVAAQSIYANPRMSPEAGSLTTLNVDRTLHTEKAQSTHASTDVGCQTACNSTIALGDDIKRTPSWPDDLRVPPRYGAGNSPSPLRSETGNQSAASLKNIRWPSCFSCCLFDW